MRNAMKYFSTDQRIYFNEKILLITFHRTNSHELGEWERYAVLWRAKDSAYCHPFILSFIHSRWTTTTVFFVFACVPFGFWFAEGGLEAGGRAHNLMQNIMRVATIASADGSGWWMRVSLFGGRWWWWWWPWWRGWTVVAGLDEDGWEWWRSKYTCKSQWRMT